MSNSENFEQIAIEIIQALRESNNGLVCKKLNHCLKKVKSIRTQNSYADKRTKFTLSEMISHGIQCSKQFKPIKKTDDYFKKSEKSDEQNTGQILRNVLNIKDTKDTTIKSMKAKSDKVDWTNDSSDEEEETSKEVATEEATPEEESSKEVATEEAESKEVATEESN